MSKKAHTPGKWEAKGLYVFAGNNCIGICDTDNDTETRMKANAKLMAAAPDMLEALKAIIESGALEFATMNQSPPGAYDVLVSKIDAALSKATGGE